MNNHDEDKDDDDDDDDDEEEEVGYEEEPWRLAVESGNVQQLQDLIQERGLAVLTRNCERDRSDVTTALLVAVRENHVAMVEYLLEHCSSVVDIDAVEWVYGDQMSWTALHIAAEKGNVEMVRYLIRQGLDVNINPNNGDCRSTALFVAAWENQIEVFRCLLETPGCDIDAATTENGTTVLSVAIEKHNLTMVQSLMEYYTKVGNAEQYSSESKLALHTVCTAEDGSVEIAKYLVETCRVDVEAVLDDDNDDEEEYDNGTRSSPLLQACQSGNLKLVQYLVRRGANVNATDEDGDSALRLSIERLEVFQYFVESHGMDIEQPNHKGETVLHYACRRGSADVVQYLVGTACNANLNAVNSDDETALHLASRKGCLVAVQCIVKSGRCTTINAQDNDGQTPLHVSCAMHDLRFDLTRYWVDTARADVSVRDKDGNTPLHIAAARGRYGRRTLLFLVTRMSADDVDDEHDPVGPGLSKRQKVQ